MGELAGKLLASEADEVGTWDHGDIGEGEDEGVPVLESVFKNQCCQFSPQDLVLAAGGNSHLTASAARTTGQRKLQSMLARLAEVKQMRRNFQG